MADLTNLLSLRLTSPTNRGMVVALGSFGARALAHLWARMRFEDVQRRTLKPWVPALRSTVAYDLILPKADGGFFAGAPNPDRDFWDNDRFIRRVLQMTPDGPSATDYEDLYQGKLPASLLPSSLLEVTGLGDNSRAGYFETAVNNARSLGDHFIRLADQARLDQDAPGIEESRFTVYLIVALREMAASALLWPLIMVLRECLESHLTAQFVGLLSIGCYAYQDRRLNEGAAIHAALQEVNQLSKKERTALAVGLPARVQRWLDRPFFDRCYLLDSEKHNLTRPAGEEEIIVAIGNALETLLMSNAPDVVAAYLGPDEKELQRYGAFGTFGTSSIYIPIDRWRETDRDKYILDLLSSEFLQPDEHLRERQQVQVNRLSPLITLDRLTPQLVRNCPFVSLASHERPAPFMGRRWLEALRWRFLGRPSVSGGVSSDGAGDAQQRSGLMRRQSRGDVGILLREAGQIQPLTRQGPSIPLPQMRVDFRRADVRLDYREEDLLTGRSRRLGPDEWLPYLYRRFRELGLDLESLTPDESSIAETQTMHWFEEMTWAIDSTRASVTEVAPDVPPLKKISVEEAAGIIPEISRYLINQLAVMIRHDNRGILLASAVVQDLLGQLAASTEKVKDYRIRLARAVNSDAFAHLWDEAARRRLQFERLLANRPRLAGLVARCWLLSTLATALFFHGLPALQWSWIATRLPLWALAGGLLIGALVGGVIWLNHRRRLRRAIRALEDQFRRRVNIEVNDLVARIMISQQAGSEDSDGQPVVVGLLPELESRLRDLDMALCRARGELERHARDLKARLGDPLVLHPPFLRQPLADVDDIRADLEEKARAARSRKDIPYSLLAEDPLQAGEEADEILTQDATRPGARERSTLRKPDSLLGDLLLSVIERFADQTLIPISPPEDLRIESLVLQREPGLRAFLNDLIRRTYPMVHWDSELVADDMPIQLEVLSLEEPADSHELAALATRLGVYPVASMDPFSITYLRLVYGMRMHSIPHLAQHAEDFRQVGSTERMNLAVFRPLLTTTGEYLADKEVANVEPNA